MTDAVAKSRGRQPGAVNETTRYVRDKLKSLGCDPIEGLARIAMDAETPIEYKVKCYTELAKYVAPQLKTVDTSQLPPDRETSTVVNVHVSFEQQLEKFNQKKKPPVIDHEPDS